MEKENREILEGNKRISPTFKQQWVLSMCDSHLLYVGHLQTDSFAPFRCCNDSTVKAFLKRMEKSGWLESDRNPAFYRLTEKSILWKKGNLVKEPSHFYRKYFTTKQ